MPCLNCGAQSTIKAHLIPGCLATEVQTGKAHAAGVKEDGTFRISQSGLFDGSILCHPCDNQIGILENYAFQSLARIREIAADQLGFRCAAPGIDGEKLVRFCAAILWKYSVTKREYGRLRLGPYQEIVREIAFDGKPIPACFDAMMLRLQRFPGDSEVFAYRAPKPDRKRGVNLIRLFVGGVLFLIRVDQQPLGEPEFAPLWLRERDEVSFGVAPAGYFEEYTLLKQLVASNGRLSQFLEKQETG